MRTRGGNDINGLKMHPEVTFELIMASYRMSATPKKTSFLDQRCIYAIGDRVSLCTDEAVI